jgi:putative membrane protein
MKKCQNSVTRLARVLQVGTTLGAVLFTASALQAQNYGYSELQVSGVTLPSGMSSQIPGMPMPLGATQDPSPLSIYPQVAFEAPPELRSSNPRGVKEFLKESARGTQTDIALANLVQARSQNTGVKGLAESVRSQATQKNNQLQPLAQRYGVAVSAQVNQGEIDRLQNARGGDFDRAYTTLLLKNDVKCINHLEKAAQEIRDPSVAAYAVVNLPKLRNEMRRTEYAARSVGVEQGAIATILSALPSEDREIALSENTESDSLTSR